MGPPPQPQDQRPRRRRREERQQPLAGVRVRRHARTRVSSRTTKLTIKIETSLDASYALQKNRFETSSVPLLRASPSLSFIIQFNRTKDTTSTSPSLADFRGRSTSAALSAAASSPTVASRPSRAPAVAAQASPPLWNRLLRLRRLSQDGLRLRPPRRTSE